MIGDDDAALVGSEFRVDRSVGVTRAGAVEPSQSFTTAGLEPTMVRPGRVTRFFMAVVAFAELDNHQEWEKRFYAEAEALRKRA